MDQEKLKLSLAKLAKRGAYALVALAISRHWLQPGQQDAATAWLIEVFEYVGLAVLGAVHAWFDAHRTMEAIAQGHAPAVTGGRVTKPRLINGQYNPQTQRFFPFDKEPPEERN